MEDRMAALIHRHLDVNSHMRNTAYLEKSADARMLFFSQNGFPAQTFAKQRFGPVVRKDEVEYFKEVNMLEEVEVNLQLAGLSSDGSHFILRNEFFRSDGQFAARVTSTGGWLDLAARKLMTPPPELVNLMLRLPKTKDFRQLPPSIKPRSE